MMLSTVKNALMSIADMIPTTKPYRPNNPQMYLLDFNVHENRRPYHYQVHVKNLVVQHEVSALLFELCDLQAEQHNSVNTDNGYPVDELNDETLNEMFKVGTRFDCPVTLSIIGHGGFLICQYVYHNTQVTARTGGKVAIAYTKRDLLC